MANPLTLETIPVSVHQQYAHRVTDGENHVGSAKRAEVQDTNFVSTAQVVDAELQHYLWAEPPPPAALFPQPPANRLDGAALLKVKSVALWKELRSLDRLTPALDKLLRAVNQAGKDDRFARGCRTAMLADRD